MFYKVINPTGVFVRQKPSVNSLAVVVRNVGTIISVVDDTVVDLDDPQNPGKMWAQTPFGMYVAIQYPSSTGNSQRMVNISDPKGFHADGLVRTRHDFETNFFMFNGVPYSRFADPALVTKPHGDPETIHGRNGSEVSIGLPPLYWNRWGKYWRELNMMANPGMAKADFERAWLSLINPARAFTNYNMFKIQDIVTGGTTLRLVTGDREYSSYYRVHCLNGKLPPPALPATMADLDMTTHFIATNLSAYRFPDGTFEVDGFPQFPHVTIVPFVSTQDYDFIHMGWLDPVLSIEQPFNQ